jgi:outer membrane protein TolC
MGISQRPGPIRNGPGRLLNYRRASAGWIQGLAFLALACLISAHGGCARMQNLTARTAASSQEPWTPPQGPQAPAVTPVKIPPELLQPGRRWSLVDLVDVGLLNSVQTRAAWGAARAASAGIDIARAAYFPYVSVNVTGTKTKGSAVGGRFTFDYSSLDGGVNLSWLLLDLGGRRAGVEEARQALAEANWTQNAVIQGVILQIEQSYYQHLASLALQESYRTSLQEAEANLQAAELRHKAGVATIADVLQARTAVSQARLDLVSAEGATETLKGTLANAMSLPADTRFEVAADLPTALPLDLVSGEVERFIAEAQSRRPDIAAARALVLRAQANVRSVRSDGLPKLTAGAGYDRVYYLHSSQPVNNYTLSVGLSIPISVGIANLYRVLQAKAEADAAKAQMDQTVQSVVLQVWTSYFSLKTAAQRIGTARDLLDSASQSYRVALDRYKSGVGSILDLLAAQAALDGGRVQVVQAKADWLLSLVQFAHDTGALAKPEPTPEGGFPVPLKKGDHRP